MTRGARRWALGLVVVLLLPGCGLEPVYSGGSKGVAATALSQIAVAPIPDQAGYLVQTALREQLGPAAADPRFRLVVALDDQIIGFGIRDNNTIAAERRTLRARYQLVAADGKILLDATTGSSVSMDRPSSDYALVAAETTALQRLADQISRQIVQRIAVFAREKGLPSEPAS